VDRREYQVEGMTCEHCVAAVTREVNAVPGVHEVDVDLSSGLLRVTGEGVSDAAVREGVEEAGYSLSR
jgi:copper chaperone